MAINWKDLPPLCGPSHLWNVSFSLLYDTLMSFLYSFTGSLEGH